MMQTFVGPMEDSASTAYLRPETAQGIFVNFKNVYQAARKPAAVRHRADRQIVSQRDHAGKLYLSRSRVRTSRTRIFRSRRRPRHGSVSVLDRPPQIVVRELWHRSRRLRFYELTEAERPHYAKAGVDVEYLFPWGWGELESIAHRGTYDLDAHMRLSGKDLSFSTRLRNRITRRSLIECSAGMDRTALTFLIDAYEREKASIRTEKKPNAPSCASIRRSRRCNSRVFSLARNKPELVERAHSIESGLRRRLRTQYDEGNIGQLYRRQDEIGTPFCIIDRLRNAR